MADGSKFYTAADIEAAGGKKVHLKAAEEAKLAKELDALDAGFDGGKNDVMIGKISYATPKDDAAMKAQLDQIEASTRAMAAAPAATAGVLASAPSTEKTKADLDAAGNKPAADIMSLKLTPIFSIAAASPAKPSGINMELASFISPSADAPIASTALDTRAGKQDFTTRPKLN